MWYTEYDSPVGTLLVAARPEGLAAIYFEDHRHFAGRGSDWMRNDAQPLLARARRQLDEYFAGRRTDFDLPLAPQGTPFQQKVWSGLRGIAYGATRSYGELAHAIGHAAAVRAVGAANGRNPLSIVVPCHRVVGGNGKLVGYAGGLERKQYLLALEARRTGA